MDLMFNNLWAGGGKKILVTVQGFRGSSFGVNDMIPKPFDHQTLRGVEALIRAIIRALEKMDVNSDG